MAYVSLPKYKSSGRIKEFAFVEFEHKSGVERCINAFQQFDGVIDSSYNPEKMKSVVTYEKEQEELESNGKTESLEKNETELNSETANEPDQESATDYETDVESLASQPPPTKRLKIGSNDSPSCNWNSSSDNLSFDANIPVEK